MQDYTEEQYYLFPQCNRNQYDYVPIYKTKDKNQTNKQPKTTNQKKQTTKTTEMIQKMKKENRWVQQPWMNIGGG